MLSQYRWLGRVIHCDESAQICSYTNTSRYSDDSILTDTIVMFNIEYQNLHELDHIFRQLVVRR